MKYFIKNLCFEDSPHDYLLEFSSMEELHCALFACVAGIPKKVSIVISDDGLVETWIIERI